MDQAIGPCYFGDLARPNSVQKAPEDLIQQTGAKDDDHEQGALTSRVDDSIVDQSDREQDSYRHEHLAEGLAGPLIHLFRNFGVFDLKRHVIDVLVTQFLSATKEAMQATLVHLNSVKYYLNYNIQKDAQR